LTVEDLSQKKRRGKVAIVGAGPAGLSAAHYLSQEGIRVAIYETEELPGGLITYGIPPYKIDKKKALEEMKRLLNHPAISFMTKTSVVNPMNLDPEYDAVFIATGGGKENLEDEIAGSQNVYRASDFLRAINLSELQGREIQMDLGSEVLVIGGGNTAMDVAISLRRMNVPKVTVVYRRSEKEIPAWPRERSRAKEEGVHFQFLLEPGSFEKENGKVKKIIFRRMELGERDPDGRASVKRSSLPPVAREAKSVIMSTGQKHAKDWIKGVGGRVDDKTGRLGNSPIFIGGDFKRGGGLIVHAVGDGKKAALEILKLLDPGKRRE